MELILALLALLAGKSILGKKPTQYTPTEGDRRREYYRDQQRKADESAARDRIFRGNDD